MAARLHDLPRAAISENLMFALMAFFWLVGVQQVDCDRHSTVMVSPDVVRKQSMTLEKCAESCVLETVIKCVYYKYIKHSHTCYLSSSDHPKVFIHVNLHDARDEKNSKTKKKMKMQAKKVEEKTNKIDDQKREVSAEKIAKLVTEVEGLKNKLDSVEELKIIIKDLKLKADEAVKSKMELQADLQKNKEEEQMSVSAFRRKLNDLSLKMAQLGGDLNGIHEKHEGYNKQMVELKKSEDKLRQRLSGTEMKTEILPSQLGHLKNFAKSMTKVLIKLRQGEDRLNSNLGSMRTEVANTPRKIMRELSKMKETQAAIVEAMSSLSDKEKDNKGKLDRTSKALRQIERGSSKYQTKVKSLKNDLESIKSETAQLKDEVYRIGDPRSSKNLKVTDKIRMLEDSVNQLASEEQGLNLRQKETERDMESVLKDVTVVQLNEQDMKVQQDSAKSKMTRLDNDVEKLRKMQMVYPSIQEVTSAQKKTVSSLKKLEDRGERSDKNTKRLQEVLVLLARKMREGEKDKNRLEAKVKKIGLKDFQLGSNQKILKNKLDEVKRELEKVRERSSKSQWENEVKIKKLVSAGGKTKTEDSRGSEDKPTSDENLIKPILDELNPKLTPEPPSGKKVTIAAEKTVKQPEKTVTATVNETKVVDKASEDISKIQPGNNSTAQKQHGQAMRKTVLQRVREKVDNVMAKPKPDRLVDKVKQAVKVANTISAKDRVIKCPTNWARMGTFCFYYVKDWLTWTEAESRCQKMGGQLATPDEKEKRLDMMKFLEKTADIASIWLSAISVHGGDGRYTWKSTGKVINENEFVRIMAGEQNESCLLVNPEENFSWKLEKCTSVRNYPSLCEIDMGKILEDFSRTTQPPPASTLASQKTSSEEKQEEVRTLMSARALKSVSESKSKPITTPELASKAASKPTTVPQPASKPMTPELSSKAASKPTTVPQPASKPMTPELASKAASKPTTVPQPASKPMTPELASKAASKPTTVPQLASKLKTTTSGPPSKAASKPTTVPQPASKLKTTTSGPLSKAASKPAVASQPVSRPITTPGPVLKQATEPGSESAIIPELASEPDFESPIIPELASEPELGSESVEIPEFASEPELGSESVEIPDLESEPELEPESEVIPEFAAEPESDLESASVIIPESTSQPVSQFATATKQASPESKPKPLPQSENKPASELSMPEPLWEASSESSTSMHGSDSIASKFEDSKELVGESFPVDTDEKTTPKAAQTTGNQVKVKRCPHLSKKYGDSCFKFVPVPQTFGGAMKVCKSYGGYLVAVKDAKQQDELEDFLETDVKHRTVWMSPSSLDSRRWVWDSTEEPVTYTNYYPGRPDARNKHRCNQVREDWNFHWFDLYCDRSTGVRSASVCQFEQV